jgi:hypothetical protein
MIPEIVVCLKCGNRMLTTPEGYMCPLCDFDNYRGAVNAV